MISFEKFAETRKIELIYLIAGALILYFLLNLIGAWIDGPTIDEPMYIATGNAYLRYGAFHLNTFHPWLVKLFAGAATLIVGAKDDGAGIAVLYAFKYVGFFFHGNPGRLHELTFAARVSVILLNTGLASALLYLTAKWMGNTAAFFLCILLLFDPTFLAHSRYVTLDVSCALLCSIAGIYIAGSLNRPFSRFWYAALLLFVSLQTKFVAWLIVPAVWVACLFHVKFKPVPAVKGTLRLALMTLVAALLTGSIYQAGVRTLDAGRVERFASRLLLEGPKELWEVTEALKYHQFLKGPRLYLAGVFSTLNLTQREKPGIVRIGGRITAKPASVYYPLVFIFKETLPSLMLLSLSLLWWIRTVCTLKAPDGRRRPIILFAAVFVAMFWAVAMNSRLNIGIRHLLPTFPLIFLLASMSLQQILRSTRMCMLKASIFVLLTLHVGSTLLSFPDLLPYFNELTLFQGGKPVAFDSNFEWGQDTWRLYKTAKKLGISDVYYSCLSGINPGLFDPSVRFHYTNLADAGRIPAGSYAAFTKSNIEMSYPAMSSWLDNQEKVADIGKTMVLYRVLQQSPG